MQKNSRSVYFKTAHGLLWYFCHSGVVFTFLVIEKLCKIAQCQNKRKFRSWITNKFSIIAESHA